MQSRAQRVHIWLLSLPDLQLLGALFVGRALLVAPLLGAFYFGNIGAPDIPSNFQRFAGSPIFLGYVLLVAPMLETLFECSLPHVILKGGIATYPWVFATVSATLMVIVHPLGMVSVFPLLTGLALAYCYLLFLQRRGPTLAFIATCAFHAAINLAGVALWQSV